MRQPLILGVPLGMEAASRRSDAAQPTAPRVTGRTAEATARRVILRRATAHRLHALAERIDPQPAPC